MFDEIGNPRSMIMYLFQLGKRPLMKVTIDLVERAVIVLSKLIISGTLIGLFLLIEYIMITTFPLGLLDPILSISIIAFLSLVSTMLILVVSIVIYGLWHEI